MLCAAPHAAVAQLSPPSHATLSAFDSAKVLALLRTRLPCLGCHVVGGSGGRIGPDLTHVASRRSAAYIRAMVTDPARAIPGTLMPRVPMPAPTRELLIAYLSANAAPGDAVPANTARPPGTEAAATVTGAALYARHCASCHGERG